MAASFGFLTVNNRQDVAPKQFAVKTIDFSKCGDSQMLQRGLERFEFEMSLWLNIPFHYNVLPALGVEVVPSPAAIRDRFPRLPLVTMPYCVRTLRAYLQDCNAVPIADRLVVAAQLCNGLEWLYAHGIEGHGDLKPENILLRDLREEFDLSEQGLPSSTHPWQVRVADLGWANAWREFGYSDKCWRPYMAPERYDGQFVPVKSDIFAVGVILWELLEGTHPTGVPVEAMSSWKKEKLREWAFSSTKKDISDVHSGEVRSLVSDCLAVDPEKRPSTIQATKTLCDSVSIGPAIYNLLDFWNRDARTKPGNTPNEHEAWARNMLASLST